MQGSCPRCGLAQELPRSGAYICSRCRETFEVYLVPRARRAPLAAAPGGRAAAVSASGVSPAAGPLGSAEASCALHADNAAVDVCERCGDFMCSLCRTEVEGRRYCARCFDLLFERGALELAQRSFTLPSTALRLALFSFPAMLACPANFVLAIAALVSGARALKQIGEQPDLPGRKSAQAALALAAVSLALAAGIVAFFAARL